MIDGLKALSSALHYAAGMFLVLLLLMLALGGVWLDLEKSRRNRKRARAGLLNQQMTNALSVEKKLTSTMTCTTSCGPNSSKSTDEFVIPVTKNGEKS